MPKNGSIWKPELAVKTVLPDKSIKMGQKLIENAKLARLVGFWNLKDADKNYQFSAFVNM